MILAFSTFYLLFNDFFSGKKMNKKQPKTTIKA